METDQAHFVVDKEECVFSPGRTLCLEKIGSGNCPDKEVHGCSSILHDNSAGSGAPQVVRTAHFMRLLVVEKKHLEPLPGDPPLTDEARKSLEEILRNSPSFSPYP